MSDHPEISFKIQNSFRRLAQEKVTPWSFLQSNMPPVQDFLGRTIRYSGVPFEGSPQYFFWNGFIEPFLEAQITEGFEIALDHVQKRGADKASCLIVARNELYVGITNIYQRMQNIDSRLRGRGNPNSVQPRDIKPAILAMHEKVNDYYASAEKSTDRGTEAVHPRLTDLVAQENSMINKNNESQRVPQSPWEAFFYAMWPLDSWKKKLILITAIIAVCCLSIWMALPEVTKVALLHFITAKLTNHSQPDQKTDAKSELASPPANLPLFEKDKSKVPPETTRPQKEAERHGGRSVQTPLQSTRTIPSSRVPQRVGKKEAQEHGSLNNSVDVGNINFQITGSTDTEKRIIERRLVDLEVKSATITITKSELDSSREVLITVTYKDNTKREYSFNTPLDNASNLIISEIDYKRRKQ